LSKIGTAILNPEQKLDLDKKKDGSHFFCHFIMNWCFKYEQDLYSRSKATAEIRFAQKTRWPPKIIFFRFVFYDELVYQI